MKRNNLQKQQGAALLVVVAIFLLILPLMIAIFTRHAIEGVTLGVSSSVRSDAADAAGRDLADLRIAIDGALQNGLLEYQPNPPAWFVANLNTPTNPFNPRSANFWQTCAHDNLCQATTINQSVGSTQTPFAIEQVVVPTGIVDPSACGQEGFAAVFYNVFIHAQASNIPADGGYTLQSVYRTCQKI